MTNEEKQALMTCIDQTAELVGKSLAGSCKRHQPEFNWLRKSGNAEAVRLFLLEILEQKKGFVDALNGLVDFCESCSGTNPVQGGESIIDTDEYARLVSFRDTVRKIHEQQLADFDRSFP